MNETLSYRYRALRNNGQLEHGLIQAKDAAEARALLIARGAFPTEISPAGTLNRQRKLRSDDLAEGFRALATLIGSGLPVSKALASAELIAPPSWSTIIPHLRERVAQGESLTTAFEGAPVRIPPILIGLIRAGEAGSGLSSALTRAADLSEEDARAKQTLRSELAYPALLLVSAAVSVGLIVGFVLPRFAGILDEIGAELPRSTRTVMAVGEAVRMGWIPAAVTLLLLLALHALIVSTPAGRVRRDEVLLRIPLAGSIWMARSVAEFASALSGLLEAGVPIAVALRTAGGSVENSAIRSRIERSRSRVIEGSPLSAALEEAQAATPIVVRLVRAGEETGRLADLLAQAGRIEAVAARNRLRMAMRFVQPVLVLGLGFTIAVVAAALLQAVYRVRP